MMISPETYYELSLKGKSKTSIQKEIKELKKEIKSLKNIIENPKDDFEIKTYPSPETQLYWTRQYLERAKKALEEVGGEYILSRQEKKNEEFILNLEDLKYIKFEYGGYFQGFTTYLIEFLEGKSTISKYHFNEPISVDEIVKEDVLNLLKNLYIGEWEKEYTAQKFGIVVCDGIQWSLTFEYHQHKRRMCSGDNCFPFNFDEFYSLFERDIEDC